MVRSRILRWFFAFIPLLLLSLAAHADIKLKVNKTEVGQGSDFSEAMEAAGFSTEDAEKAKEVIEISIISGEFMDWESLSFFVNLTRLEILYNVECAAEEQEYFKGSKIEAVAIYSNIEIPNKMFSGAKKLRTLKLEGATTVGESAFKNCKVLTTISLPSVTSLGSEAFFGCEKVKTLRMPVLTTIGEKTFDGMKALQSVYFPSLEKIESPQFKGCSNLKELFLPACSEVAADVFKGNASIEKVEMSSLISIGENAFEDCTNLKRIAMPSVSIVGSAAFKGCIALASVYLPTLSDLETSLFEGCTALESVQFSTGDNPVKFGENVFKGCTKLNLFTLAKLPEGATEALFADCANPRTLNLTADVHSDFEHDVNFKGEKWIGWDVPEFPTGSLVFKVIDKADPMGTKPIVGARIKVSKDGAVLAEFLTDTEGIASFVRSSDEEEGNYTYEVSAEHAEGVITKTIALKSDTHQPIVEEVSGLKWKKCKVNKQVAQGGQLTVKLDNVDAPTEVVAGSLLALNVEVGEGYSLVKFTANGALIGQNAKYEVTEDVNFKAEFEKNSGGSSAKQYKVIIKTSEHGKLTVVRKADKQEVHSGDMLEEGTELVLKVEPEDGYMLKELTSEREGGYPMPLLMGDAVHECETQLMFNVTYDATFEAAEMCTVTMTQASEGGTMDVVYNMTKISAAASNTAKVLKDKSVVITVTPAAGYTIKKLEAITSDGTEVLLENVTESKEKTYMVYMDVELKVTFAKEPEVVITVTPPEHGTIDFYLDLPDGTTKELTERPVHVKNGASVKIVCEPSPDKTYQLDKLLVTKGSETIDLAKDITKKPGKVASIPYKVTGNCTVAVTFVKPKTSVEVTFNTPEHGTLTLEKGSDKLTTSPATVPINTELMLTVKPANGYILDKLTMTVDGVQTILSENFDGEKTYKQRITDDVEFNASFKHKPIMLNVDCNVPKHGELVLMIKDQKLGTGMVSIEMNTEITLMVTPDNGYMLEKLTVSKSGGTPEMLLENLEGQQTKNYMVTEAVTFAASFKAKDKPKVSVKYNSPEHGRFILLQGSTELSANPAEVEKDTELTLKLEPASGYLLDKLMVKRGSAQPSLLYENLEGVQEKQFTVTESVEFEASFKQKEKAKVTVTYQAIGGGRLEVTKKADGVAIAQNAEVEIGTVLVLKLTPEANKKLDNLTITIDSGAPTKLLDNKEGEQTIEYTVETGKKSVVFAANFKEKENSSPCNVAFKSVEHGTISFFMDGSALTLPKVLQAKTKIEIVVVPESGYQLEKLVAIVNNKPTTLAEGGESEKRVSYTVENNVVFEATFKKTKPDAVEDNFFAQVKLYPNPAVDQVTLQGTEAVRTLTVVNALGVLFKSVQVRGESTVQLAIEELPLGVYFVVLKGDGVVCRTIRFVKQ